MLSVCIVNWNTKTYLRECLASIAAYPPDGDDIEVIVVDNASTDGSAAMVAEEFSEVILLAQTQNVGYADGNNIALRRAIGDVLLLLNPDVRVNEFTFTNALKFLRQMPRAGAISVLFRNSDGTVQPSLRGFPTPSALFFELSGIRRLDTSSKLLGAYFMTWFKYDKVIEADQPMGTFLMIPRTAYESVGELDSDYPIFFNEVDWCYRAKRLGWKIYFTPDAEIIHYGGQGTKKAPKRSMVRESHMSLIKFYENHYSTGMNTATLSLIRFAIRASCALQSVLARS